MTKKISRTKGETVALAILDMDVQWAAIFADLDMTDLNYSDLFMRMWMAKEMELTKTALYDFMPGVSRRTAVRYVQNLVDNGWLIERQAGDKRIKYVELSTEINSRLEHFLDFAFDRLGRVKG
ncbi:MAG: MarR family transcriptional regulator [Burkholderiaceae bacterium]